MCNETFCQLCSFQNMSDHDHCNDTRLQGKKLSHTATDTLNNKFALYLASRGYSFHILGDSFAKEFNSLKAAYWLGSFSIIWSSKYHFFSNYCNSIFINTRSHLAFLHQWTSQVTGDIYKLCAKHRHNIMRPKWHFRRLEMKVMVPALCRLTGSFAVLQQTACVVTASR